MLIAAVLGLLAGGVAVARRRSTAAAPVSQTGRRERRDAPARIVAAAEQLLPAARREWGRAMAAELAAINGRDRWRFAAGVTGVALAPPGHRIRAAIVGAVTAGSTAFGMLTADRTVPQLEVFAATFGVLLTVALTGIALRRARPTAAGSVTAAAVAAGATSTIVTVVIVARAHPAATSDPSHLYAVVLAVVLAGYLVLATASAPAASGAVWWGLAGAAASGLAWAALLPSHATVEGLGLQLWPVGGIAALLASIAAARTHRQTKAGARAALTAAIVSAPLFFTLDLARVLTLHQYVLTAPYDIAHYPHSGFPDVASFVLSDTLGGGVVGVLVMYPLALLGVGTLGGIIGAAGRRPHPGPPPQHEQPSHSPDAQ